MKAQLTYFADVLGCPTKALYWMHGVENTFHGFVELAGDSYLAFVQHPENRDKIDKLKIAFSHLGEKVKEVFKEQNMKTTGGPAAEGK